MAQITLEEDARRYVEALRSPANGWGVYMVPYMRTIKGELKKDWTTVDGWRSYMCRRYGVKATDKAIDEALGQSFTHRSTVWFYEGTEES
jgi:hypothetical protein